MESFAAAPVAAEENPQPCVAAASLSRVSAFRLPRHIRFSTEFVASLEMRATMSQTTPFFTINTLVPEDLSLVAAFFSFFLKVALLVNLFSDPYLTSLEIPSPT